MVNMARKLLLALGILVCILQHLGAADSKDGPGESITEKIYKINKVDKAPKCLKDGDIMNENCKGKASKRNAVRDRNHIWHTRRIPVVFHKSLTVRQRVAIIQAIHDFHRYTCIRFYLTRSSSRLHYIRFIRGRGCWSWIGKTNRKYQDISIGHGCGIKGIAIHEIMHALGFWHEQSRYDRDHYIRIIWNNIQRNRWNNFRKKTIQQVTSLGLPYDYDGIMHYGPYAFAINRRRKTIVKKRNTGGRIGQRRGFSYTDIAQLNRLYSCESPQSASWSHWSSWSHCLQFGRRRREQSQRFCISSNLYRCRGADGKRVQMRPRACGSGVTEVKRSLTCEWRRHHLRCPNGYRIHVYSANYGRTSRYICNGPRIPIRTTNCRARSSLHVVRYRFRCQGRQSCTVHARNNYFGDPCWGTYKYLDVRYRCYRPRPSVPTWTACEHRRQWLSCRRGYVLNIIRANYGRTNRRTCPSRLIRTIRCYARRSLPIVRSKCNGKQRCLLYASNRVFGDPCRGTYKYLQVQYQCRRPRVPTWTACEHRRQWLSCRSGYVLNIIRANYGRTNRRTCPSRHIRTTRCYARRSLPIVRSKCNGKQRCLLYASNRVFGDPCWGTYKYLQVQYQCRRRRG